MSKFEAGSKVNIEIILLKIFFSIVIFFCGSEGGGEGRG